jgi:hypothetical protein
MSLNPTSHHRASRFPSPTTISVASLLNPLPHASPQSPSGRDTPFTPSLTFASCTPSITSAPSTPPQQSASLTLKRPPTTAPRPAKDAPLFTTTPSPTNGSVNYPPYERYTPSTTTDHLLSELSRFEIFPLGSIATHGVRHIPYASAKKGFFERTGRESFEVFQYTFKPPSSVINNAALIDKTYTVMWDYNIGLVRITPFFKCCGFSKVSPSSSSAPTEAPLIVKRPLPRRCSPRILTCKAIASQSPADLSQHKATGYRS